MQTSQMEQIMDAADAYCRTHSERLSHAQVFDHARDVIVSELNQIRFVKMIFAITRELNRWASSRSVVKFGERCRISS